MRVEFDKLVADYDSGLFTKLRGFGGAAGFLETWVPDADPVESICNMLDAASTEGLDGLSVFIGATTAAGLDADKLTEAAGGFGTVCMEPQADGLLLTVLDVQDWADSGRFREAGRGGDYVRKAEASATLDAAGAQRIAGKAGEIGPHYAVAVKAAANDVSFEGTLDNGNGPVRACGERDGVSLTLLVDGDGHTIRRAAHSGASTSVERALLDRLCALIVGLPIQEAADHGVIRLEYELRDKTMERPVAGVVTPEAADASFLLPLALVRGALGDYRSKTGYGETENTYDPQPSAPWMSMDGEARRKFLDGAIREIGYSAKDVVVTAIEFDVRVVVELAVADKQRCLMALEAGIKDKVDARLELFLEEIKDINKLRRPDAGNLGAGNLGAGETS